MTTPKEALEGLIEAVTRDANEPGGRGISGYTSARLSDAKSALACLQGEDAVERVELPLARAINDVLNAMVDAQEEMTTTKISARILGDDIVRAILAAGLVADEAAIRADEREKCAKNDLLRTMEQECWSLRCVDIPTGGGDADVGWEVVSHHMAKPHDRVVASGRTPREALAAAIRSGGGE